MAEGLPTTHSSASVSLNEGTQVRAGVDKDRNGDFFCHCFKDRKGDTHLSFVALYLRNVQDNLSAFMEKSKNNHKS